MSLERRYRTVLYWYPSTWREQNADAVLGTLLDEADATGRTRPRRSELASLALNGIRARLSVSVSASVGFRDRLAALALGAGFALTIAMFLGGEWNPFYSWSAVVNGVADRFGPFRSATTVVYGLWLLGFGFQMAGLVRCGRIALLLTVPASLAVIGGSGAAPMLVSRPAATSLLFVMVLAILACVGRVARSRAALAAVGTAAVFVAIGVAMSLVLDWSVTGLLWANTSIAANGWWVVAIFAIAAGVARRAHSWVLPLVLLGLVRAAFSVVARYTHVSVWDLQTWAVPVAFIAAALATAGAAARRQHLKRP